MGRIETDHLVVGAGAVGLAFTDALVEHSDLEVVLVDQQDGPGGHWRHAYPFVRLHQPSANYGLASTPLGEGRLDDDGPNRGFHELATGRELCAYFDAALERLVATGRVRFLPQSTWLGDGRVRSDATGEVTEVVVRRKVVDATRLASRVPATEPPPFEVADGATCVPVNALADGPAPPGGYVIVGGGKTATDAVTFLLAQGTDPDTITWIRPREAWLLNRRNFQPGDGAIDTFEAVVLEMEAVATASDVEAAYDQLEAAGVMLRIDPDVRPSMAKGSTVSEAELAGLRRVTDVVRLGHVRRIERDRIVLDGGTVPTGPDRLHVHCAAPGITTTAAVPVFEDDAITIQPTIRMHPTLSAALTGFLETSDRTTEEKNELLWANPYSDTPYEFLRVMVTSLAIEMGWRPAPDVRAWLDGCRLNVLRGLEERADSDRLRDLQTRLLTAIFPALERIDALDPAVDLSRSRSAAAGA